MLMYDTTVNYWDCQTRLPLPFLKTQTKLRPFWGFGLNSDLIGQPAFIDSLDSQKKEKNTCVRTKYVFQSPKKVRKKYFLAMKSTHKVRKMSEKLRKGARKMSEKSIFRGPNFFKTHWSSWKLET